MKTQVPQVRQRRPEHRDRAEIAAMVSKRSPTGIRRTGVEKPGPRTTMRFFHAGHFARSACPAGQMVEPIVPGGDEQVSRSPSIAAIACASAWLASDSRLRAADTWTPIIVVAVVRSNARGRGRRPRSKPIGQLAVHHARLLDPVLSRPIIASTGLAVAQRYPDFGHVLDAAEYVDGSTSGIATRNMPRGQRASVSDSKRL